jgi:heme A synthase
VLLVCTALAAAYVAHRHLAHPRWRWHLGLLLLLLVSLQAATGVLPLLLLVLP